MSLEVRPLAETDRAWLADVVVERWGSDIVVAHGVIYRPTDLDGFVAREDDRRLGVVTISRHGTEIEIVTIDAFEERRGVGRALVDAVRDLGADRVWLITTNDNVGAQSFYEAMGFRLLEVREGAIEASRVLKPEIPLLGDDGTPIRDELVFEWRRA